MYLENILVLEELLIELKLLSVLILERWIINSKSDVLEIRLDMYDKDRKLNRRLCIFLIFLMLFSC